MGDIPTRTRKFRTEYGTITEKSHDGGKTWRESHREELPPRPPGQSNPPAPSKSAEPTTSRDRPERTTCRHQAHGICLTCHNADIVARREAHGGKVKE